MLEKQRLSDAQNQINTGSIFFVMQKNTMNYFK